MVPDTASPVDGFTVGHEDGTVSMTLTSRYGDGEKFTFEALDAARIGQALVEHALLALKPS